MARLTSNSFMSPGEPNRKKRNSFGYWLKAVAERINLIFFHLVRTRGWRDEELSQSSKSNISADQNAVKERPSGGGADR
ncbi:hypothetical protein D9M70_402950 [compost metagenome]